MSRANEPEQQPFMPDSSCMDITDEKFKELKDITVNMVEECELGKNTDMAPMLMVHFREFDKEMMPSDIQGAVIVVAGGFGPETKHDMLEAIGVQFFNKRWFPIAVFMVSEAWVSMLKSTDSYNPDMTPSKDPNRKECIMIAGRTIGSECKAGVMIPITHDDKGVMIRDGENTVTDSIDTILLDHFFHGFFSKIKGDVDLKYKSKGRT
jgi:hypothetical protein